jgi:Xaa-Pro aminopeptidase
MPAVNGYPVTVIFPKDDRMSVVQQGPFDLVREFPPEGDGVMRGVKHSYHTPSYASAPFTAGYDPELAAKALAPYGKATVGLVGAYTLSHALIDGLRKGVLAGAKLVDASDMVDRIKVIKSPEELELIRKTALMQDGAMRAAIAALKPGVRDRDVAAAAKLYSEQHGSEQGIYLCGSAPAGTAPSIANSHLQARTVQKGDHFAMLVENAGAGGYYTELGRVIVLGKASQQMKDELEFTKASRQLTLDLLKPGTSSAEVWERFNDFMRKNKRPEERRLYCHGQGYDLVERPLVRRDETMPIAADMNIVVHPSYAVDGKFLSWLCDNYIIGKDGPGPRIHQFPEEIVELDV